ncbi:bifunctional AP-4-A phosphorylase/ADP sulfurylase [Saitozyma podzolica]|uniref:Bifunctional AP-4-A phosphorylase/ADP sulfurylase n=1 Tax=Saitozyma podzolica TaxID=1890683 RepID=A0A427YED3_9TREE|nr:bifunctional AP-4-A phosphorylase/ADP sulfurylase [Saitozyma podzolica]
MTWPPTSDSSSELIDALAPAVMRLLDIAFDANRRANIGSGGGWNLIMTLDHLHLIPRTAPSFQLPDPHQPLELNSLGYAGMMLVRSGEEEQTLLEAVGEGGLMKVLEACGLPRTWGEQALEAEAKQQGMGELA